jgi:hypothetical protein
VLQPYRIKSEIAKEMVFMDRYRLIVASIQLAGTNSSSTMQQNRNESHIDAYGHSVFTEKKRKEKNRRLQMHLILVQTRSINCKTNSLSIRITYMGIDTHAYMNQSNFMHT